ncbi:MAG: sigma-E factor negative regulatory protein [Gammaproteobacteria bacterium]|nr:sigma-E factor negative regulatory protein [Gammaproteobacteria bacterium]
MSERIRESLSALIDNEANELELERVLSQSEQIELRATWTRFQMARAVMRGDAVSALHDMDISGRVREALAAESGAATTQVSRWRTLLRPVASFAVAASVFAAVVVGSQLYGLLGPAPAAGDSTQLAARVSPVGMVNTLGGAAVNVSYGAPALKSASPNRRAAYNQLARQRLQRYMVPHADQAALNTAQGMMPYARVSSFQAEE